MLKTTGTGTATSNVSNPSRSFDIIVSYADEKNGQGSLALHVGGKLIENWKLDEDVDCWKRKTIPKVKIKNGDEVKIVCMANGKESARIDFIEFVPQNSQTKLVFT